MRVYFSFITFLILMGLFTIANAQVTAVMEVKVKVISSSGLIQYKVPTAEANPGAQNKLRNESFFVKTTPGSDVDIRVTEKEGGKADWQLSTNAKTGEHTVTLSSGTFGSKTGSAEQKKELIAVVEYL